MESGKAVADATCLLVLGLLCPIAVIVFGLDKVETFPREVSTFSRSPT